MKTEIEKICDILTHSFEKNAWHGPSVMEVLSNIDENIVDNKINTTHSILELIGHMTTWKTFVSEKLVGNESFDVNEEMNFPASKSLSEAVTSLRKSQEKLLQSLKQFPPERLNEIVPNRPYKFYTMVHGVIHHDLYHLGQIVLIKRIHE